MIAFPGMLVGAAAKAGMAVPNDIENYDPNDFPHWWVFTAIQLGAPMPYAGCHWDNAQVVADIPLSEIKSVTPNDLVSKGFAYGYSTP